jgi:hypothetical protein
MDDFHRELLGRLPLAEATWTLLRYVIRDELAAELFERHRGSGYEGQIPFATLIELVADALLEHRGSGRRSFERALRDGRLHATPRAAYGKLARVRRELSQALLAESAARLRPLVPAGSQEALPPSLTRYRAVILDGKKLKNFPKRMKSLSAYGGKMLGGKAVVALVLPEGLAAAMETSLDGEANDAPLAPRLIDEVRRRVEGPRLFLADRQFCDLTIPPLIVAGGDHFLIRYTKKMGFFPEDRRELVDRQGRTIIDERGFVGRPQEKRRFYGRRTTLLRPGEEEVSVLTDLVDDVQTPAEDLLDLYLQRWTIERVFQQISEVFRLEQLIGSTPRGAIFQFAFCLLLYNLLQVVRMYVAEHQQRSARSISNEMMFRDLRDQFTALLLMGERSQLGTKLSKTNSAATVGERLDELLQSQWSPLWQKTPARRRGPPLPKRPLPGGHASAWKIIQHARYQ